MLLIGELISFCLIAFQNMSCMLMTADYQINDSNLQSQELQEIVWFFFLLSYKFKGLENKLII